MQRRKDELEVWKQFPLNPNVEVSTLGRIKKNGKFVKPSSKGAHGYLRVNTGTHERYLHRIVLLTFKNQPVGKNFANHINGDKKDNRLCNLEWSTSRENTLLAARDGKFSQQPGKPTPVKVTWPDGRWEIYPSQKEANNAIGGDKRGASINKALRGDRKTTHGVKVEYVNESYWENSKQITLDEWCDF